MDVGRSLLAEDRTSEVTRDPWSLYIEEIGCGSLGYDGLLPFRLPPPFPASALAGHRRLGKFCKRAGDRQLIIPFAPATAFRKALRELGPIHPARLRTRLNRLPSFMLLS